MPRKRSNRRIDPTGRSERGERFIKLPHFLVNSPAYRSLSLGARALLIEVWERHNGVNNGEISFSVREAAERLSIHRDTASKAFHELEYKGFLCPRERGSFTYKVRHATKWEITAEPYRDKPASKDFMSWKPANEIQNTVLTSGTDRPNEQDRVMREGTKNTRHGPNQQDRHAEYTHSHGPTERDSSNIPGGFQGNGTDETRDAASLAELLAIPGCFDRRRQKIAVQPPQHPPYDPADDE